MKFSQKIGILSLLLVSLNLSYANSIPTQCPSPASIQAHGVDSPGGTDGLFLAEISEFQKYDTQNYWFFAVGHECGLFESCEFPTDILNKANTALKTLTFVRGPKKDRNEWKCYYRVDNKYFNYVIAGSR